MNEDYLILLENIHNVMAEIRELEEGLHTLLSNPVEYLSTLESVRDTLMEIKSLEGDA